MMIVRRRQGILINRFLALVRLDFGYARIKPADLHLMLFAGLFLVLLYGVLFYGERKKGIS